MITLASPSLRSAALVLALAGCTDRDPLGTASASASSSSTGTDPETGSSGAPTGGGTPGTTSEGPSPMTTTTTTADSSTTALDTGDPTGGDVNGQFLLAVSTVIAPDLPLQFLATTTQTVANGQTSLSLELQPLSLDQDKVTTPREPVGDPIFFKGVPVVDGMFEFDAGVVEVDGAANPITGGDLTASLFLKMGTIVSDDFYCGNVEGQLINPLRLPLTGSTFAAQRVAGLDDLTNGVVIDCLGQVVLDP